jgi:hypothetical protein
LADEEWALRPAGSHEFIPSSQLCNRLLHKLVFEHSSLYWNVFSQ